MIDIIKAARAAFEAGVKWGGDSATSYEWGCAPSQTKEDAWADFMAHWNADSAPLRALIPTNGDQE